MSKLTKKPKANPQQHCIAFKDALAQMGVLKQPGMLVKFFRIIVVSPEGNKLTLTFDPVKFHKIANRTPEAAK